MEAPDEEGVESDYYTESVFLHFVCCYSLNQSHCQMLQSFGLPMMAGHVNFLEERIRIMRKNVVRTILVQLERLICFNQGQELVCRLP